MQSLLSAANLLEMLNVRDACCQVSRGTQTSGQSYKGSTIVNYGFRVMIWGIFKSGTYNFRVVIYHRWAFQRLTTTPNGINIFQCSVEKSTFICLNKTHDFQHPIKVLYIAVALVPYAKICL